MRRLQKLASEDEVREEAERRARVYTGVHEDSSTVSTKQFASAVEFPKTSIQVAVGLVFDAHQRVLITQRAWEKSHAGFWEFPGGKLEDDEDPKLALSREMSEELGIEVVSASLWQELAHDYPDYQVQLLAFKIFSFLGTPRCCEDQLDLRWVSAQELPDYAFPAANLPLVQALRPPFMRALLRSHFNRGLKWVREQGHFVANNKY